MRIIKRLARDIECNIDEAENKIDTAYRLKDTDPTCAAWYKEMAIAHLGFNGKGHEIVSSAINSAKNSSEYKEHADYYSGMMAVWQDKHADIVAHSARVKAMIDNYR